MRLLIQMLMVLTFSVSSVAASVERPLVYAMYTDIKDWDPAVAASTEVILLSNVYESLVWYSPPIAGDSSAPVLSPGLATSWSVDPGGKRWTFTLRKGVKFHDGEVFDSAAAKASIERVKRLNKGSAYIWDAVVSITAPDVHTLVITTKTPIPVDLIASSQYAAYMVSPKAMQAGTDWFNQGNDGGSGPYRVKRWTRGQEVMLERFDAYWGGWKPAQISAVQMKVVSEATKQAQMIRSGEADFVALPSADMVKPLAKDPGVTVLKGLSWKNTQFLFNTKKPPTDNVQFRRALTHAWDYKTVVDKIYEGEATVANGLIPSSMWGNGPTLMSRPTFDLKRAAELLALSGVPPSQRRISVSYVSTSEAYRQSLQLFKTNLKTIGVELELKPGPWDKIWEDAKQTDRAPNMISMTWWPTYATPSDWLIGLFRTESPTVFNLSHYSNQRYDNLINRGVIWESVDRGAASVTYGHAHQLLIDEAVAIFVADLQGRLIFRSDLKGVVLNPAYDAVKFYELTR